MDCRSAESTSAAAAAAPNNSQPRFNESATDNGRVSFDRGKFRPDLAIFLLSLFLSLSLSLSLSPSLSIYIKLESVRDFDSRPEL